MAGRATGYISGQPVLMQSRHELRAACMRSPAGSSKKMVTRSLYYPLRAGSSVVGSGRLAAAESWSGILALRVPVEGAWHWIATAEPARFWDMKYETSDGNNEVRHSLDVPSLLVHQEGGFPITKHGKLKWKEGSSSGLNVMQVTLDGR